MTSKTKRMIFAGIFLALTFSATYFIWLPVPFTTGYIHPGDSMVFLAGVLLGPYYGAFAAGLGSALADLSLGYPQWIIPTLIIKALMAYLVGLITHKPSKKTLFFSSVLFIGLWLVFQTSVSFILNQVKNNSKQLTALVASLGEEATMASVSQQVQTTQMTLLVMLLLVPLFIGLLYFILSKKSQQKLPLQYTLSFILAGTVMVFLYYMSYGIIYGNFIVPILSIPLNLIQFALGFIIAQLLAPIVIKIKKT